MNKKKITFTVAITSLVVFILYLINKLIFLISTRKEKLYSNNSNYYNWRFGKIFYTKNGNGPAVLLIHDLNCTSSDYEWKNIIHTLSENHTVYTIDLLGCGRSDKPKITYTCYLYVQLLSDFIKNIIKHKTHVIVTGKSSASILMACHIDAQLFNNIILVNPEKISSLNKYPKYKHKLLKYTIEIPILGTFVYNIIMSKKVISQSFKKSYFANSHKLKGNELIAYYEAAHLGGSSAKFLYASIQSHFTNTNIIHALKEINNNILIISGEQLTDNKTIPSEYITLNPSIETIYIKNSKYLPQLENSDDFIKICEIYLQNL